MAPTRPTPAAVLIVAVMFCLSAVFPATVDAQFDCIFKLKPCEIFNTTAKPSTDCCSLVKDVAENDYVCLCGFYTTPGLLESFNLTAAQILQLGKDCGVPSYLSACSKIPGIGKGAAANITWNGLVALLLIFFSFLFY